MAQLSGYALESLREDREIGLFRARPLDSAQRDRLLVIDVASPSLTPSAAQQIQNEYRLADELESAWALRPHALLSEGGRAIMLVEDPGGQLLQRLLAQPMEPLRGLRIAISLTAALDKVHLQGLIHKDINPANVFVDEADEVRLTGFGIASRLQRDRQSPTPPHTIGGSLPYIAPEQTGRMNRSIDSRSDLYSLGVTLYELFVGAPPFVANEPMDWIYCHLARTPIAPATRMRSIPTQVSSLIMKLLAKSPEDRYQSAAGVFSDLSRCLDDWLSGVADRPFELGENDVRGHLLVPERLYGREKDISQLLGAFDRVAQDGNSELVLVSGYSGIGKSSVVSELHKVLFPTRGLFATGKSDESKNHIPYATLTQALQSLVRQILTQDEPVLLSWAETLAQALHPNGQLVLNLVPELELIVGKQPTVADLAPQDSKARFQQVLSRLMGAFASESHPLALFLDDAQWLDTATLDLIGVLLAEPSLRHLMVVMAYRSNEVDETHYLMRSLSQIREICSSVTDIVLSPLTQDELTQLVLCEGEDRRQSVLFASVHGCA
jgi:serine/threonine protein kinase